MATKKEDSQVPQTLFEKVDFVDKWFSKWLHQCVVRPKFLELTIFPFAFAFSPIFVPFIIYATGFLLPKINASKTPKELLDEELLPVNPYEIMLNYALQVLIVLIFTTLGKRLTKRLRPVVSGDSRRWVDFRTKETNGSLPSGDTAQAALLTFFLKFNFPHLYESLG